MPILPRICSRSVSLAWLGQEIRLKTQSAFDEASKEPKITSRQSLMDMNSQPLVRIPSPPANAKKGDCCIRVLMMHTRARDAYACS